MHMTATQLALAIAGPAVQLFLLVLLIKRNLRVRFPFFFTYTAFSMISTVVEDLSYRFPPRQYFFIYWALTAVETLLAFGVLYEVFVHILKPYSALIDLGKLLFKWAGVFLLIVSLTAVVASTGSQPMRICAAIILLERIILLMQCGLLLLLVGFESRLGLSWRNYGMCIALGLGAYAAVSLSVSYLSAHFAQWQAALGVADSFAYFVCLVYWAFSLALPEPSRKSVLDSPSRLIFQRWNEALMATPLVGRKNQAVLSPIESFLPGVEQTVERVMARKMH